MSPARLRDVLARFYGFWAATEPFIDSALSALPTDTSFATALDWPRRRRSDHLRDDVIALGGELADVPLAAPTFGVIGADSGVGTEACVLGWLYVTEGSTLGGAVLERRLRPLLADLGVRLRSFTPYAEGPGPMWQAYHRVLDDWVGDDDLRAGAVVAAAEASFEALADWLEPLHDEVAA